MSEKLEKGLEFFREMRSGVEAIRFGIAEGVGRNNEKLYLNMLVDYVFHYGGECLVTITREEGLSQITHNAISFEHTVYFHYDTSKKVSNVFRIYEQLNGFKRDIETRLPYDAEFNFKLTYEIEKHHFSIKPVYLDNPVGNFEVRQSIREIRDALKLFISSKFKSVDALKHKNEFLIIENEKLKNKIDELELAVAQFTGENIRDMRAFSADRLLNKRKTQDYFRATSLDNLKRLQERLAELETR